MIGHEAAKKLNLQEGLLMPTKPWYQSKTIWSDVATVIVAIVGLVDKYATHGVITASPAYSTVVALLGAMGIYGRATTTSTISS